MALWHEVAAILAASPIAGAQEWAIYDYEGFGGVRTSEYKGLYSVAELAGFIADHAALGAAILDHCDGDLVFRHSNPCDGVIGYVTGDGEQEIRVTCVVQAAKISGPIIIPAQISRHIFQGYQIVELNSRQIGSILFDRDHSIVPESFEQARHRGQRLTSGSAVDSRLSFGGGVGRADRGIE